MRPCLLLVALACNGPEVPDDTGSRPGIEGPEITLAPPPPALLEGESVTFEAEAIDPDGVETVVLFYRTSGDLPYLDISMELLDDTWTATVEDVEAPALEYFLRATDASSLQAQSALPTAGSEGPRNIPVAQIPTLVPYTQPFDETNTPFGVYEVGWTEFSLSFRGQHWDVDAEGGLTGGAAFHPDGFFESPAVDDWLVSPALDFTSLDSAEVRWAEFGLGTDLATHSLWVSTGSADPEEGEFVKIRDLSPPPEGAWGPAPVVDLTDFAGMSRVILAWRYEGQDADTWALDDVTVREFAPDLQLVEVDAGRVEPGDTVGLTVTLENIGAPTSGDVVLTGASVVADAVFTDSALLGPMGTAVSATGVLPLELGPAVADNTLLELDLSATDGVDTFDWSTAIQVGDPTIGLVRLHTTAPGLVQVWIGTGNPVQPHVLEPVFLGNLPGNVHTFSVELSDHIEYLPSEPGRLRWWVRMNTEAPSSLLGFGIDFDGEVIWSDTVGPFPEGEDEYAYLPARADPVVLGLTTSPSPLIPGAEATVQLTIENQGGFTTGTTEARFDTPDPDLSLSLSVLPVSTGPWASDGVVVLDLPITVAATHTNSAPLPLNVTLWDPLEFYPLAVALEVPWPDLIVGSGVVVDPAGNADGLLDPGEQASLDFDVRNDGTVDTGAVTCTMSQESGPTLTVPVNMVDLGVLAVATSNVASFAVTANAGVLGDEVMFRVSCTDGVVTTDSVLDLVLGQRGWTVLPLDPGGDTLPGGLLDLREIRWRIDGDWLEVEIRSATDFDSSELAMELWMDNVGSQWQEHAVTIDNGLGTVWGLLSNGFNELDDAFLVFVGTDTVRIRMDTTEMDLGEDAVQLAVGSGFCGTDALYCDAAPDDWGNPYSGPLDFSLWYTLDW